jgi:predicted DNA-binding mobile mystery protein A
LRCPLCKPPAAWLVAGRSRSSRNYHTRSLPQTVASFEKSEAADRITLQTLRRYAEALDCELVYAIVPKNGSLKQLEETRVRAKAERDVRAVEHTMALEDQATHGIQDKIERETKRMLKKR